MSEFTRKWNYLTNIQGGVKPITNNGSNEFLVDLSKYDGFTLDGYLKSSGGSLCNGQIFVHLRIDIKDLEGNVLESLSLFDKVEYITAPQCTASGRIFYPVDEVIPLSDFVKHKSGRGINETIMVDVFAQTQAGVAGIKGDGGYYSHDISLMFALIERDDIMKFPSKAVTPEIVTPEIVATSSLIPLAAIGLLLYTTRDKN